jgi:hypothetical protein
MPANDTRYVRIRILDAGRFDNGGWEVLDQVGIVRHLPLGLPGGEHSPFEEHSWRKIA